MKTLNERQLQVHGPIVAWLLIVTNGLLAVTYLLIIALTLGAPAYLLMRALAFPALMVALAIPGLIAGFGLRERKAWARNPRPAIKPGIADATINAGKAKPRIKR